MSSRVFIGTAGRGTLQLDDGRTLKLNGFGGLAQLSDGTELLVSGTGYLAIPDMTTTSIQLDPTSGAATNVSVLVTGNNVEKTQPTGTLRVEINGQQYTLQTLDNGTAMIAIPESAFNDGPGNYTIAVSYSGDANFSGSSTSQVFAFVPF
jgi:hypothetical protein